MTIINQTLKNHYKSLQKRLASVYKIEEQPLVWADVDLLSDSAVLECLLYLTALGKFVRDNEVSEIFDEFDFQTAVSTWLNESTYTIEDTDSQVDCRSRGSSAQ